MEKNNYAILQRAIRVVQSCNTIDQLNNSIDYICRCIQIGTNYDWRKDNQSYHEWYDYILNMLKNKKKEIVHGTEQNISTILR